MIPTSNTACLIVVLLALDTVCMLSCFRNALKHQPEQTLTAATAFSTVCA